jgi:bifunctional UDP-N-acetylglucosamine pyrophosphorylase/glucosamine-1-phosphate N-acetyltransferase
MRSSLPKVLHQIAGKSMLERVLDALAGAGFPCPTVVLGHEAEAIRQQAGERCRYVEQVPQLGTGDAARVGLGSLPPSVQRVLLVHGDEPMIDPGVYREMLDLQATSGAAIVLLTTIVEDTRDFGRVVRDADGRPAALVQQSDLTPEQKATIREINLGAYVFDAAFLRRTLPNLQPNPPKGEYYLTDLIAVAAQTGEGIEARVLEGGDTLLGINDLVQLEGANRAIYARNARRLMAAGVTIIDSATTYIGDDVRIEPDTIVYPLTCISGHTMIGRGCVVGPGATIEDATIGDRCTIRASTIESATIEEDVRVGPYAHLRPGAHVGARAEIGNYAEIKASTVGPGTRMHHFGYIGDAQIGRDVNIGAGVITCNYDGTTKHRTTVGDNAFIGSDTMLRAPVTVGDDAYTGAGSVVTRDVPDGALAVGVPARVVGRRNGRAEDL